MIILHDWLLGRPDIDMDDKILICVIMANYNESGWCNMSQAELGLIVGGARKKINMSIARLTGLDGHRKNGRGKSRAGSYYKVKFLLKSNCCGKKLAYRVDPNIQDILKQGNVRNNHNQKIISDPFKRAIKRTPIGDGKRFKVLKRDNFQCVTCGAIAKDTELVIDHILPVSTGGTNELGNLRTLCVRCNAGRGDKV